MSPTLTFPVLDLYFYRASAPIFILCLASILSMLLSVFRFGNQKDQGASPSAMFALQAGALLLALASLCLESPTVDNSIFLGGAYVAESISKFSQILILLIALFISFLFKESHLERAFFRAEVPALFQLVCLGMLIMTSSLDMITLFVGLELSSIGLYALIGYISPSQKSREGAMKYFVLGSMASAFFLFGTSFLYIGSGSLNLVSITEHLRNSANIWLQFGAVLALLGLVFKLALVPFHSWAPDAYEAAPTGLTAFMASAVKIMILTVLLRMSQGGLGLFRPVWIDFFMILSLLSMLAGNLLAMVQTNLKRMLAYSSIAHSGYIALALCSLGAQQTFPYQAILFYLLGYTLSSLLAFGSLMELESEACENIQLDDLSGLFKRRPWLSATLSVSLLSLAGIPPSVGFFAKFFVFNAAIQREFYFLVLAGVLGSLLSLFYYLRVIVYMYMREPKEHPSAIGTRPSFLSRYVLAFSLLGTILLGTVLPQWTLDFLKPVTLFFIKS
ncbi:MAG: NADH-quinone oxidoreductase subunit N [Oligoflexales bacterium]|nr:NADH-quinone oxidoreductase subunit N [Oligoflexales bacterium]